MSDQARNVAFDERAPADERFDAQSELQKANTPTALSDLIPREDLRPVIEYIQNSIADAEMAKAMGSNVVPFPSKAVRDKDLGMQSVYLDDLQISVMGDYYEKPTAFGFDSMRYMVEQTPILSAVVSTRINQAKRFCRVQENGRGPGFEIRMREKEAHAGKDQKQSIQDLQNFFTHCGWESNPRQRRKLKRDDLSNLMAKLLRDTLSMDSMPIETEFKRNKALGMSGIYAVDGATIRLCTETGYKGDDEIFALQVVQGRISTAYTFDDLIYQPRNPRTDVLIGGYGLSETELLIRTVTGFLNAMSYNSKFFDSNQIPKGMLHMNGNYTEQDIAAFKRYWNSMVKGVTNAWSLPVMISKDSESKASFEKFGVDVDEMMFSKWMTFLTSLICAIYGIAPEEINFESFSTRTGGLGGDSQEEKMASSKDKGFRPLMAYFENIFSDFIVADFSDQYCFRWTGMDEEDEKTRNENRKLILTVNEFRAQEGQDKVAGAWGDAPVNPALIGVWQAEQQANSQDFGDADAAADPDAGAVGGGKDFGQGGDFGADKKEKTSKGQDAVDNLAPGEQGEPVEDMGKAFGFPIFRVDA